MLEHLDKNETRVFFNESFRILKPNGVMRIVVPDFQRIIDNYKFDKDVDKFVYDSCLVGKKPKTLIKKLQYLIQGHGWHHQMFNKDSLKSFKKLKFSNVELIEPGETKIGYNTSIDLNERKRIIKYSKIILNKAIYFGGSSIRDFKGINGKSGNFFIYSPIYIYT